jgi:hypothetical protein
MGEFRPSLPGERRGGRQKGTPNKATNDIKAMILGALSDVGGRDYLARQAIENPGPFMTLVGKVLPTQLTSDSIGDHWALHLIAARAIAQELRAERETLSIEGKVREVTDEQPADLSAPALE